MNKGDAVRRPGRATELPGGFGAGDLTARDASLEPIGGVGVEAPPVPAGPQNAAPTSVFVPLLDDPSTTEGAPPQQGITWGAVALALVVPPIGLWRLARRAPGRRGTVLIASAGALALWVCVGMVVQRTLTPHGSKQPAPAAPVTAGSPGPSSLASPAAPPPAPPPPAGVMIIAQDQTVPRGSRSSLAAQTSPGAQCSIRVTYSFGQSRALGLVAKPADASGRVDWTWTVATTVPPGTWPIQVDCGAAGSAATTFRVT